MTKRYSGRHKRERGYILEAIGLIFGAALIILTLIKLLSGS